MNDININALVLLANSFDGKNRPEIAVGRHVVDFQLQVYGSLLKSEPEWKANHFKVDYKTLALLGLSHLNTNTVNHILHLYDGGLRVGKGDCQEVKQAIALYVAGKVQQEVFHSGKVTGKVFCAEK
jgi:hypothetical protein